MTAAILLACSLYAIFGSLCAIGIIKSFPRLTRWMKGGRW